MTATEKRRECPEAFRHGPADGAGRCPWCRAKYASAMKVCSPRTQSDLTVAYRRFYDPDWGSDIADADPTR